MLCRVSGQASTEWAQAEFQSGTQIGSTYRVPEHNPRIRLFASERRPFVPLDGQRPIALVLPLHDEPAKTCQVAGQSVWRF